MMSDTDINLAMVEKWLKEAGEISLKQRESVSASSKLDGSLVTDVDHQIEEYLYDQISRHYPEHRILAEEGNGQVSDSEYLWTIDPIDGTRAYATGLPVWGISIGILKQGKPFAGMFSMPALKELYRSSQAGAYLNQNPISPLNPVSIEDTLAFIAVPSSAHLLYDISFRRLRSLGSTTAHLIYVARGAALAALTRPLYIWDIAPVMLLLKAAGIGVEYLSGKNFDMEKLLDGSPSPEPLIAAPQNLIDSIRGLIRKKADNLKK